jgi:hypothetical protein
MIINFSFDIDVVSLAYLVKKVLWIHTIGPFIKEKLQDYQFYLWICDITA